MICSGRSRSHPRSQPTCSATTWKGAVTMTGTRYLHCDWQKSSYSTNGGNCVEVCTNLRSTVPVRDSKLSGSPVIAVRPAAWSVFIEAVGAASPQN
ncbi:DUF397 domain-containing protein [Streptomyces albidoflavus]